MCFLKHLIMHQYSLNTITIIVYFQAVIVFILILCIFQTTLHWIFSRRFSVPKLLEVERQEVDLKFFIDFRFLFQKRNYWICWFHKYNLVKRGHNLAPIGDPSAWRGWINQLSHFTGTRSSAGMVKREPAIRAMTAEIVEGWDFCEIELPIQYLLLMRSHPHPSVDCIAQMHTTFDTFFSHMVESIDVTKFKGK